MRDDVRESKPNLWWFLLLLAPFVGVLWVPFFNHITPEIWGIPFFFWYQFLWVIISALITALVYFKTTRRSTRDPLPTNMKERKGSRS